LPAVHHKNNNDDDNPAEGGNRELLWTCCHENAHARLIDTAARADIRDPMNSATFNPFAALRVKLAARKKP